jgi:hypothetical protein
VNDSLPSSHLSDPDALAAHGLRSAHLGDSLPGIVAGLMILLFAAASWLGHFAPQGSVAVRATLLVLCVLVPLAAIVLAFAPAFPWLRRQFLTARSGYVRYKPRHQGGFMGAAAAGLSGVFTLVVLGYKGVLPQNWQLIITGALMGGLWMFRGRGPRFLVNGALMAVSAILLGFSRPGPEIAWSAFFAFAGVLNLATGAAVLLRFIRSTSEAAQ